MGRTLLAKLVTDQSCLVFLRPLGPHPSARPLSDRKRHLVLSPCSEGLLFEDWTWS